jgi:uncharacterized protein YegL
MNSFQYQIGKEEGYVSNVLKSSTKYGLLSFKIDNKQSTIAKKLLFCLMMDVSGSMSDIVSDKRTKMDLLKLTITNMLYHFAEKCENIYIQINTFDSEIYNVCEPTLVNSESIDGLVEKIKKIRPQNSTNIGLAIKTLNENMKKPNQKWNLEIEEKNCIGILLTDGEPTDGITNVEKLVDMVTSEQSQHFIALGDRHNADLMQKIGNKNRFTSHWFINELEMTGSVYGEIIFNELNRRYEDCVIEVQNGMIYDYYNGCFVEKLEIGNLYNESNKNYHLQITDSENLNITFRGKHLYDGHDATVIAYPSTTTLMAAKQYFRLGVQYLMYLVRNEPPQPYIFDRMNRFRGNEVLNVLKTKIITLKSSITTFMEENELLDDEFMKELLKDLNVMKNVQGNTNQYMYLTARENAQGRETSYNMNSQFDESETIVNNDSSPPVLERASAGVYATPGRLNMMREVSDSSRTPNII